MEAGKRLISEIFNGGRVLEIPFFQRAYVWEEPQWSRLLDDMIEISKLKQPYFLGSVILKQQETSSSASSGDIRTLIDGQQRLTTLLIFFKVLTIKMNENNLFDIFKLRREKTIALRHNHNDEDSFNKIMEIESLENFNSTNSNIINAYNYFKENLQIEDFDYYNILDNIMFVGIDLNSNEDEQQIFDTINSLGVRLSTAELLKNFLFDKKDLQSYEKNWKNIFEKDDEIKEFWDKEVTAGRQKRQNIDLFFYAFLQIKIQDKTLALKTEEKNKLRKISGLFDNFKEFIKITQTNKYALIQEIKEYALIYQKNIDFTITDSELTDEASIDRINALIFGLDNTVLIPYILYIEKNALEPSKKDLYSYLESFIMRRMIVKANNKNYNNLFTETLIAKEILTKQQFKELIDEKTDQHNAMPSDIDVKKGFFDSKLVNKQSAGILYLLESKIRDKKKHSTALLGLDRYSLEHLMPKKWKNNWNNITTEEEKHNRNSKLLTLGNLAIITTALNSSIRDSSWDIKLNGKNSKKGLREFGNALDTLSIYLSYSEWNENTIEERANFLYENSVKIWES